MINIDEGGGGGEGDEGGEEGGEVEVGGEEGGEGEGGGEEGGEGEGGGEGGGGEQKHRSRFGAAIVGIITALIVVALSVVLLIAGVWWYWRKR